MFRFVVDTKISERMDRVVAINDGAVREKKQTGLATEYLVVKT